MTLPLQSFDAQRVQGLTRSMTDTYQAGSVYSRGTAGTIFVTLPTTGSFVSVREISFSSDIKFSVAGPKIEFYRSDDATPLVATSFTGSLWHMPHYDDGTRQISKDVIQVNNQLPQSVALKARVTWPGAGSIYMRALIDYTNNERI